jgi:hypothetical protein
VNRSGLLRSALPRLVAVAVLVGGAALIFRDRHHLQQAVSTIGAGGALLALVCALFGTVCIEQVWACLLAGLGAEVPARESARVFLVSQLGKYLPGSVWPVLAQMEFGRRRRIPRGTMLAANMLMLTVVTATGLLAAAVLLPWSSAASLRDYWWTLILIPPLLGLLHPRAIPAVIDRLLRLLRRPPLNVSVLPAPMARAIAWGFATWLLLGTHLLIMARALGGHGASVVAASIGGMALAFAAGLIFIPAPAGAGVREAVIVATLADLIGSSGALAVALASRVLLVLADVLLAAGAGLLGRRSSAVGVRDQVDADGPAAADSKDV